MNNQKHSAFQHKIYAIRLLLLLCIVSLLYSACNNRSNNDNPPNILWIYLEDTSPLLGCYGTSIISTPNIDKLAKAGTLYTNAIMPAPVCSASRSSIITGMMSTTLGLHNHHSSRTEESAIHLPDSIKTVPEIFKAAGYFTFNNGKDDYNFAYDRMDLYDQDYSYHPLYGKRGTRLPISDLRVKEPFFGQIQLSGGKEIFSSTFRQNVENPVDRNIIELPPFLPNHPVLVEEYANHLDAIQITDRKVGKILEELNETGLLNNTIIFFFSDHGMRLTRHKQFLYEGGIRIPFIITDFRNTRSIEANSVNDDLISGLDLGPVTLVLAGIGVPTYMEGINFLDESTQPRTFVISTRDRCDFTIDRIRSVRSKDYKFIRNFMTDRPYSQPTYMDVDGVEFVHVMKQLYKDDQLHAVQSRFMSRERPAIELYNLQQDPFELNNLADHPEYAEVLQEHDDVLQKWIGETDDKGQYPENEEGLKLMLGIWGQHAVNPEYDALRAAYPDLEGSLWALKTSNWERVAR